MKRYHVVILKRLMIGLLAIAGVVGIMSLYQVAGSEAQVTESNFLSDNGVKPGHPYAYKLGDAMDVESSINNYEQTTKKQSQIIQAQRDALEAEQLVAKKEAEEKVKVEQAALQAQEANLVSEEQNNKAVQATEKAESSNESVVNPSQSNAQPKAQAAAVASKKVIEPKPAAQPVAKVAPKPEPKQVSIGSNKIGINGNFKSYTNYGRASTDKLQSGIDAGLIVAGLNSFNGNDGATTYFGGHNPGIMNFMASSIRIGATITVTDSNGTAFNYKMIDKVDVDEYGEGMLKSIGVSAIDAYMYGTGSESILIQFCNTNNNLMSFWYGVKI